MRLNILCLILLISTIICGQNVAINSSGTTADDSAILDISSTSKGLLIPRMTNTQMNNIVSPVEGLVIYNKN